jgi:hypothetical protein
VIPPDTPFEKDRHILPFVLVERGLTGVGVEVGVCRGEFSAHILTHWPGRLWCVDAWADLPGYEDEVYDYEANYSEALSRLAVFGSRCDVLRLPSVEAADRFDEGSLDFVYIDADHSYKACYEDLCAWYPKVKKGGIIAGDDYSHSSEIQVNFGLRDKPYTFGVNRAVQQFALEHQKNVSIDWCAGWGFEAAIGDQPPRMFRARNFWFCR